MPARCSLLGNMLLAGLLIGLSDEAVFAQNVVKKPSPKQDEKRENEAVKDAQQTLQEAREKLKDAEKSAGDDQARLRQAVAAQKSATKDLQQVQDRLEVEHGEKTGLTAARKKLKDIESEYDRAAKPILDRVHAEQKPLLDRLEKAKQAIRPKADEPNDDRSAAVAEHNKLMKELRDAEQQALAADATVKPLQRKVEDVRALLDVALKKFETAVERDGDLRAARQAFERSKREQDNAEAAVAKAQRSVADARQRVAMATQKLQQKQAADAKDSNKPKNKKKN